MGFLGLRIKLFEVDESNPWPHPTEFIIFLHYTSIVSVSITLFAAYCIIYKSGQMAKTYKHLLLIHLTWTFTHELNCNTFTNPVIFTPFKAGYYNGLFEWMGVPPRYTITFSFALVGANLLSFTQLFAFRLYSVLPPSSIFHKRFLATYLFIILYILLIMLVAAPTYILYDADADRLAVATEQWGHIPQQLYQWNVLFFARSFRNNMIAVAFIIMISAVSLCSCVLAISTGVVAYGGLIFIPCFIVLAGAMLFEFLPIVFSNGVVFLMSVSGTFDTLAMLGLTKNYRIFMAHNINRVLVSLGLSKGLNSTDGTPVASTSGSNPNRNNNPAPPQP